jgi:hypothetical protein
MGRDEVQTHAMKEERIGGAQRFAYAVNCILIYFTGSEVSDPDTAKTSGDPMLALLKR